MSGAPICHIPTTKVDPQTPTNTMPAIPIAEPNMRSLVTSINALRQHVMRLSGTDNSGLQPSPQGSNGFKTDQKKPQWSEKSRVVEKIRVFQNGDKTSENWVDIEQINKLDMVDKNTGQTWSWTRTRK